ncbi:MAG TPA: VWA domain-containing protein [Thermoanaerobaculia bacterium]|nr:VWA domain-containing protein [Thermoanaerobaculia bacterium]
MKRVLCWLILGILLPGVFSVQTSAQTPAQTFSDRTDVVVVEVPVQVIGSDGKPVRGLTADDFEVYEGRKKQPLVGFEALDLASRPADWQEAAPVAARRHFLMMFDFTFSSPKGLVQAREAARELVELLHPSDLVSVASYTTDKGTELLLQFTGDRNQILAGIDRLGLRSFRREEQAPDPLGLVADTAMLDDPIINTGDGGRGRAAIDASEMERVVAAEVSRSTQITKERSVASMARSYGELARLMSSVRGRKYVLLFSEGFDSALLTGSANTDEQLEMAEGTDLWNIDSGARFGSTKTVSQIEEMLEEFRRADCVIQAVDIAGLRGGVVGHAQFAGGKDSLFLMARETGGELFENYNQLGVAVAKVLERTSVTYVLAFQPQVERDGSYHRLKVELKNGPRGARVIHRPGYYAPRAYDKQSPLEKALVAGQSLVAGEDRGEIRTSVLAAPFAAQSGPAYVPVLIEVDGPTLTAGMKGGALPTDIYAYAFDAEGRVRDFFSQTVGLDLAKVGPALQQGGLKFFGHLDLPPGDWSVRVLVRNGATGAMGLQVATVQVPEPSKPRLLPAFFPEPQGKWLIVREAPRQGDREVPYPFMLGEQPYIPASMPVLAAGQGTSVSLVGYHLKPGELRAEAKILTADGREAGTGRIDGLERLDPAADGSHRMVATFAPPEGLKPGEYMLMITVTDPAGASETSVTPFEVVAQPG